MDAAPPTPPPPVSIVSTGAPTLTPPPPPPQRVRRLGDRLEKGLAPFLAAAVLVIVLYDLYLIASSVH